MSVSDPAPEPILLRYSRAALSALRADYDATQIIRHAVSRGSAREAVLHDFIRNHLPELITVVSGEIVDSKGGTSKQQDLVLILKTVPRMRFSHSVELIFAEGVVGVMEIKSSIDPRNLSQAVENFASVACLKIEIGAYSQMGVSHSWPSSKILTMLVGYDGIPIEKTADLLSGVPEPSRPDIVFSMTGGLLVKNHGLLLPQPNTPAAYISYDDPAKGLMILLAMLAEITGTVTGRGVQWRKYWS